MKQFILICLSSIMFIFLFFWLSPLSNKIVSDTAESSNGVDFYSDNSFSPEDFYVLNHPILKTQHYEQAAISELMNPNSTFTITCSPEGPNGHYLYYIEDSIIYVLHSSNKEQLYGIVLTADQYSFQNGLKTEMALDELLNLNFVIKERPDISDLSIGQIVKTNLSEGALCNLQYDKIYTISGTLISNKTTAEYNTLSPVQSFVIFCNENKVVAVATDLPTAG